MNELDLLKKDWKTREKEYPKLSYSEFYNLIHKKSSSIVKWLFIISLIELSFWTILNFIMPDNAYEIYEKFHLKTALLALQIMHYFIVFIFIYLFYKNYKSICVVDTTKMLMKNILKTRKTVIYYVYYNVGLTALILIAFNIIMFSQPDLMMEAYNPNHLPIAEDRFFKLMLIGQIIGFVIFIGLLILFYRIVYGILLKRLNKNYKELKNLE